MSAPFGNLPKPNLWERALSTVAPKAAATSYLGRTGLISVGQYAGARHSRTALKSWNPLAGSGDADTIGDLPTLRSRSRDLARNAAIARGARNTSRVNVVGSGLRLKACVKRELLNMSEEDAEAWEANAESLFDVWASSKMADVTRTQNFYELQSLAFTSAWESGDVFALRRYKEGSSFLALCLQLIEADRVCTPTDKVSNPTFRDGVETDGDGSAIAYHVLNRHPGDVAAMSVVERPEDWARIPAEGAGTGQSLILHLFDRERVAMSRGVPALAAVIEDLKQLDRYSEAELMAAVVSAFFTVFIKNSDGTPTDLIGENMAGPFGGDGVPGSPNEVALGSGSVVELGAGEDIVTANPARPNANFDPFFLAIVRKIGVSLGIPYEVLIMHFSSSYSASRAALEVAWQFFMDRRTWLARNFCQPVYEWFLFESVARGVINCPGFDDPIRRAAWCGSEWIGPCRIVLDPLKEAEGEEAWINMGVKTLEEVTVTQTGGNWKRNQEQRGRERTMRVDLDLEAATPPATESATGRPLQSVASGASTSKSTSASGAKPKSKDP